MLAAFCLASLFGLGCQRPTFSYELLRVPPLLNDAQKLPRDSEDELHGAKHGGNEQNVEVQESLTDLYGDPLPSGAIARAGTIRLNPGARVEQVFFSPTGTEVFSWSEGVFCQWDAGSGELLQRHEFPQATLAAVGFMGSHHSLALIQSTSGQHLWDFVAGQEPPAVGPPAGAGVIDSDREYFSRFAISADGKLLAGATSGRDGSPIIRVWKYEPGKQLHELEETGRFPQGMKHLGWMQFTDDGSWLMTLGGKAIAMEAEIVVHNVTLNQEMARFDAGMVNFQGLQCAVALSPMGDRLAVGTPDESIRIFDLITGEKQREIPTGEIIHCMKFVSSDLLATGGRNKVIRVWDVDQEQQIQQFAGHTSWIETLDVSPEHKRLVSGGQDKTVRLWDLESGQQIHKSDGHQKPANSLALTSDGQTMVTGGFDGRILFWETETGRQLHQIELDYPVIALALSADDQLLAVGLALEQPASDPVLLLFDVSTRKLLRTFKEQEGVGSNSLTFSRDSQLLFAGEVENPIVRAWNVQAGEQTRTFELSPPDGTLKTDYRGGVIAVSPDKPLLACSGGANSPNNLSYVLNAESGETLVEIPSPRGVKAISFVPNAPQLVTGGHSAAKAFAPDGRDLSSPDFRDSVQLWNIETGDVLAQFAGHDSGNGYRLVHDVAVSPHGQWIATGERGGAIDIYNLKTGNRLTTLRHSSEVYCVRFTPDGHRLITVGADLTALVWDFESLLDQPPK